MLTETDLLNLVEYRLEPPRIDSSGAWFSITFLRKAVHAAVEPVREDTSVGDKVMDKVTDNQRRILDLIQSDSLITIPAISERIGISTRKTADNLKKLRKKSMLRRVGSPRAGHWELNANPKSTP